MSKNIYHIIGLMSGTSLDGLDIAYCRFEFFESKWNVEIIHAETIEFKEEIKIRLLEAHNFTAERLKKLDVDLGHFFGKSVDAFIQKHSLKPEFVASHGHTIFHNPKENYTLQIGDGPAIASYLNCPLIFDFRSADVAFGGQGAPLVPIGDKLLFSEYDACINLGGFANISFDSNYQRIAFDICPVNFVLNEYSRCLGFEYDDQGKISKGGNQIPELIQTLNNLAFYTENYPKSLGREWVSKNVFPLFDNLKPEDIMASFTEHISIQISNILNKHQLNKVLFSGGGVKNSFLMEKIREKTHAEIHIPNTKLIDFKEAMIFAFLGVLRMQNQINVLSSVTGARKNHCAGSIVNGTS